MLKTQARHVFFFVKSITHIRPKKLSAALFLQQRAFLCFMLLSCLSLVDRCDVNQGQLLHICIFQLLSIVPGTSRSGATIIGGILLGCSRELASEYTFFLAVPVMFGASLLKLVKHGFAFTGVEVAIMIVGMLVAFAVSIFAIKFLMQYIKKHDFKAFGWYRIVLGVIVLLYFVIKTVILIS